MTDDKDLYRIIGWHSLEPTHPERPLIVDGTPYYDEGEKAEALRQAILCRFNADDDLDTPPTPQEDPSL